MEESHVIHAVRQRVQEWIHASDWTKVLNLAGMNITELPADIFAGCSQVQRIWLFNNQLKELPSGLFAGCSQLRGVYMEDNQLKELPADLFAGCSQLEQIGLSYNNLIELPADLFIGCSKLRSIALHNNQLKELPANILAGCSKLISIWLHDNQLKELPADLFMECLHLNLMKFDELLIYGVLWSLPNFDVAEYGTGWAELLTNKFPIECALIKRYRRVANDPRSYAWSVRKYAVVN